MVTCSKNPASRWGIFNPRHFGLLLSKSDLESIYPCDKKLICKQNFLHSLMKLFSVTGTTTRLFPSLKAGIFDSIETTWGPKNID